MSSGILLAVDNLIKIISEYDQVEEKQDIPAETVESTGTTRPEIDFLHKEINIQTSYSDDAKESEFINLFYFADCYNTIYVPQAKYVYDREKTVYPSFTVCGGDYFGGGALSKYDKGTMMLQVLQDFDCCVSAIGNHEFDFGVQNAVSKFIESSKYITWLCTNLDYKGDDTKVNIYDLITININGKKIGLFALLDKNTNSKLSSENGADFTDNFVLYTDIHDISKKAVHALTNQYKCDMIVVISHMDGYYREGTSIRENEESNALSCVVKGVDLMLDASNHESIAGVIFADLFRGSQLMDKELDKLPGYVMGGVDLDYFNHVVINTNSMNDDYSYYMHRTSNFPANKEIKQKYDEMVSKYLEENNLVLHEVTLSVTFRLNTFRSIPEYQLTQIIYDIIKEKQTNLDLLILPAGLVRSNAKYVINQSFTSYMLSMIFAFGLNIYIFEGNKKALLEFKAEFGDNIGSGSFPHFCPKDIETSFKDDQTIICALSSYHFDGGDNYPFGECKKLGEHDILHYMNNEKQLSHFGTPSKV